MSRLVSKAALAALALLFALNLAASRRAAAQNYYVSTSGSDSSGNGSVSSPWATIAHASTHVGPGATVHVAAGVYSGDFNTSSSGTSSAYIIYEGDTANFSGPVNCAQIAANHGDLTQCPRLVGDSSNSGTWNNMGDYVEIKGFDVTGPASNFINGIYTQGNATVITENNVHDMLGSTCPSMGGSGINLNGTNAQVTDNYIHNIGPYPSSCGYVQGIYFLQAGGFAYNNISFDNSGFGIQLWHYPSHIALVNNTIFHNASGGIVLGTDNSGVTVDYITVEDNIVVNNSGVGIAEQGCCSTSTGIHNLYENNLVYGNSGGAYRLQNGLTASGTVNSSPGFVNDTGDKRGDYHLQSGSPAIGAALSSSTPSTDFDSNARPQNGSYDIGSYEYVGSSTSTATLSISPTSAGFSSTTVGTTSPAQTLTLTNKSSSAVSLSGISISGANSADFAETDNCGSSVAASGSCSIDVTFTPQSSGTLTATLTITPSSGSALQVALSGTGADATAAPVSTAPAKVTPGVSVSPASSQISAAQSLAVTVTVSGGTGNPTPTGTVILGSGSYTSAATALTNGTATITIPAGSLSNGNDTLNASYSPDATSSTIYNGATGTATVKVSGSKLKMSAKHASMGKGGSATSTVTVSSDTGYTGTVSLACAVTTSPAGATDLPTCSTTGTVTLNSTTTSGTTAVRVSSAGTTSASIAPTAPNGRGWAATGGAVLAFLLLPWIPRKRRKWLSLSVLAIAVTLFGGLAGCGGGPVTGSAQASSGTTAGQYTITVTGTGNDAAKTQTSTTFTLTVN